MLSNQTQYICNKIEFSRMMRLYTLYREQKDNLLVRCDTNSYNNQNQNHRVKHWSTMKTTSSTTKTIMTSKKQPKENLADKCTSNKYGSFALLIIQQMKRFFSIYWKLHFQLNFNISIVFHLITMLFFSFFVRPIYYRIGDNIYCVCVCMCTWYILFWFYLFYLSIAFSRLFSNFQTNLETWMALVWRLRFSIVFLFTLLPSGSMAYSKQPLNRNTISMHLDYITTLLALMHCLMRANANK